MSYQESWAHKTLAQAKASRPTHDYIIAIVHANVSIERLKLCKDPRPTMPTFSITFLRNHAHHTHFIT